MSRVKFVNRMIHRAFFVPILSALVIETALAQPSDRVRLMRGNATGEVSEMTPLEVTLNKGQTNSRAIAVNEIKSIVFDAEPTELSQARVSVLNGAYKAAQDNLHKLPIGMVRRDFVQQDIEFYKAWCASKLALAGEAEISEAGRQLNTFVRAYPNNYHYLAAVEMMGDLLMAAGRADPARKQYTEIAKAPWADYKMRAAVAIGRTYQAEGKHAEAVEQFEAALAFPAEGADAENQRLAATLGKAVSLAENGSVDDAVGIIEKVIQDADPQEKELHARAYNALGSCYRKANKTKDALLAYLHVDVLYSTQPEAHAEALANLVPLWEQIGQNERSRQSRELLEERYGNSRWARQAN